MLTREQILPPIYIFAGAIKAAIGLICAFRRWIVSFLLVMGCVDVVASN